MKTWMLVALAAVALAPEVGEAQNRCYNCHLAQQRTEDAEHLRDWRDSAHDRAGVGCEDCHGGDAGTLVQVSAHRGVMRSSLQGSPTHWKNLPATCGQCHQPLFAAAQQSPHRPLFEEGERRAPSCVTCHGTLAVAGLGSGGLSGQCSVCHEEGSSVREAMARVNYLRRIREVREVVRRLGRRVALLPDTDASQQAGVAYAEGRRLWDEAIEVAHAFELEEMLILLDRSEARLGELATLLERSPDGER